MDVGAHLVASIHVSTCGGGHVVQDDNIAWTSADTNVASVEALTGLVTARQSGTTTISAKEQGGAQLYSFRMTVR